jgi:hypothetical protein
VLGLLTIITFSGNSPFIPYDDREFDQALWKSYAGIDDVDNPRLRMAADVQRNHIKVGMTREEVVAILGEGMTREEVVAILGEPDSHSDKRYGYGLGWSDGLVGLPRLYFFDIYFDSSGKVVEARIAFD